MVRCHNNLRKSGALRMDLRYSVKFCTILGGFLFFSQKQKYAILNPFLCLALGIYYDMSLSFLCYIVFPLSHTGKVKEHQGWPSMCTSLQR